MQQYLAISTDNTLKICSVLKNSLKITELFIMEPLLEKPVKWVILYLGYI